MHNVSTCAQWCVVRKLLEDDVGERNPAPAGCAGDFFAVDAWFVTGAVYSSSSPFSPDKVSKKGLSSRGQGTPVMYTQCLAHLRRCLVVFGGLSHSSAAVFTLHSLKTTILSWGLQLNLPESDRGAQGHHRCPAPGVSKCVPRYGRDDIVDKHWAPNVPLDRGHHFLQLDAKGCTQHVFCSCDSHGFPSRASGGSFAC